MARMFCTLEEAANRLCTTADQLEALLAEGALQEFRDGTNRLLRSADVASLAVERTSHVLKPPVLSPIHELSPEIDELDLSTPPVVEPEVVTDRALRPPTKTSRKPSRPGLRSWRSSRRQGLWTGVLDDRPSAILAAFILMVLLVLGLAAGAYFLSHKL